MHRAALAVALLAVLLGAAPSADAARSVPRGFTGMVWDKEIQDAPPDVQHQQWATMAEAGVETTRAIFGWHLAQPDKDKPPSFVLTDAMVEQAALHGIDLLPVVTYAPRWARVIPNDEASAPLDIPAYTRYLTALVKRYGPAGTFWKLRPDLPRRPVRAWQVWNEPHLPWQFSPHGQWERRYGRILRRSYKAIKSADPHATVVLGGLANLAWNELARLYKRGHIRGWYDVAAVHIYSRDPADFVEIARRFRQTLDGFKDRRVPIYVTEAGASASWGKLHLPDQEHFQLRDEELAALIDPVYRRLARLRRSLRIERVYWYTWASPYTEESGVFGYSGLNTYRSGGAVEPRPALDGYRNMAIALQGCRKDASARCVP
jgi:hypothetical protein